jgi:hypothetical protein
MKKAGYVWMAVLCVAAATRAEPVKLIFDTDMGNDTDDLMALCMIHTLQSRGAVDLLAVTITKDHPQAAAFVDAVNTFYGRPDIPVGVVKGGVTPEPGKFNLLAALVPAPRFNMIRYMGTAAVPGGLSVSAGYKRGWRAPASPQALRLGGTLEAGVRRRRAGVRPLRRFGGGGVGG